MKKLFLLLIAFVSVVVWADDPPFTEPDTGIDVPVCLNNPGHNTGHCGKRVNGIGSACVKKGFLQSKNCFGDTIGDKLTN